MEMTPDFDLRSIDWAMIYVSTSEPTLLGDEYKGIPREMVRYMDVKKCLRTLTEVYMENINNVLYSKIERGDFQWQNDVVQKFLPRDAEKISHLCRTTIQIAMQHTNRSAAFIAFVYCFTHPVPISPYIQVTSFHLQGMHEVDLDATKGNVFKYNDETQKYHVFNQPIEDTSLKEERMEVSLSGEIRKKVGKFGWS
ncbi:hypothetical protein LSTR_LSTR001017 [Laodelphax striatellus]|uniref:Uncharacterized protein n=1 Tax=Laodelphax striatellus TaxID=195883 RepID=A0A482X1N8_LAOST|nr:hypothetical protein LSTR_LSTR001017 [Laodelphax striatellus]